MTNKPSDPTDLRERTKLWRLIDSHFDTDLLSVEGTREISQAIDHLVNQECEKRVRQAEIRARLDEHKEWVLPNTETSHEWEQDGEGSGIQYFDNERLARLRALEQQLSLNEEENV